MAFMHTFENPIIEARTETGMTLQNLGKRLGLSRQYISRAEQGTYSGLNKDLVKFVASQLEISSREVVRRYEAFQIVTRRRTAANLNPEVLSRNNSSDSGHVLFAIWRSSYWPSTTSFSNGLCIHPEIVRNYEEGITPAMPDPIRSALISVNLLDPNWSEVPTGRITKPLGARVRA
jgi:transcriptional regulator with XRE-family HTH domain